MTDSATDPVSGALAALLGEVASLREGRVADYIPELSTADPDDVAIALVSVLGRTYAAGRSQHRFTIQSISKPFIYALALQDHGLEQVAHHVGFEPSGEPFNAISLDPDTGRPANPLINAGAIVTSALVAGSDPDERFDRIRRTMSAFAGRDLSVDDAVYRSESDTGDRNRALAHLARSAGVLPRDVDDAVEVYFRQCAVLVCAEDVALMSATLANHGTNPRTGERVVEEHVATQTLSVMATCGMYDNSGEWMVRVGLPAKSGVGGGIAAVHTGEFGIGVYSPPLDDFGNSVRGVAILQRMSAEFGLHLLGRAAEPRSPVASSHAHEGVEVVALRGELDFIAAEQLASHLRTVADQPDVSTIRIDLTGVSRVRPAAGRLLAVAAGVFAGRVDLVIDDPAGMLAGERDT